jgi:hypothetical protein
MDRERSRREREREREMRVIFLVENLKGNHPLGKSWRSCEDNIKMDVVVIRIPTVFTHIMLI